MKGQEGALAILELAVAWAWERSCYLLVFPCPCLCPIEISQCNYHFYCLTA